jgi:hypothetical protein
MKIRIAMLTSLVPAVVLMAAVLSPRAALGQSLLPVGTPIAAEGDPFLGSSPDSDLYALGTQAINQARWSDAVTLFTQVADQKGDHAAGALYWKAYAENKQGQSSHALDTCAGLRRDYSRSSWTDECGALEIEIHARAGQPVSPDTQQSDDLKLLALNSLMQRDEKKARAQIDEIVNGDSSERLKEGALFLLGDRLPDAENPQIVRISYLDGDVRIARGDQNDHGKSASWETAVTNLPLETGDSLVTGNGRAEIELENASTLYLGENSVLTCNDLHTISGVPHTELGLLTGTVTLHLDSMMPGETFLLRTPADTLVTRYPEWADLRINSYMDALAITPLRAGVFHPGSGTGQLMTVGHTLYLREGRPVDHQDTDTSSQFAAWDAWVADRFTQRSAAMTDAMKASGLTAPIPGLAELKSSGSFFDCAPYGTCWEPAADIEKPADAQVYAAPPSPQPASPQDPTSGTKLNSASPFPPRVVGITDDFFPCTPEALRYWYLRDPVTGKIRYLGAGYNASLNPYDWGVCHAGSWIRRHNRYVWVVGHKRHHHAPVHWVKNGRTVAFVPLHPRDIKGKPPVNREYGFVPVKEKNGLSLKSAPFDPARPVEVLKSAPREYRNVPTLALAHTEAPHMEAHVLKDPNSGKGVAGKPVSIPLSFDHKSQSFMAAKTVMQGARNVTVMAPVSNHSGNLQARGGGSSGGGGSHAGGGGGSSHSGGGGSSGGGSRGGGGSSGSTSSSSSSGSSGGSSGGSSHH